MEEKDRKAKLISIGRISSILFVLAALMTVIVIFMLVRLYSSHQKIVEYTRLYSECDSAIDDFSEASQYLTAEARLFVDTGNMTNMSLYDKEVHSVMRREKALEILTSLDAEYVERQEYYQNAMDYSEKLEDMELHAMALAAQGYGKTSDALITSDVKNYGLNEQEKSLKANHALEEAKDLMYSKDYVKIQENITYNINRFRLSILDTLNEKLDDETKHFKNCMMNLVVTVIIFFMFVYFMFLVMHESLLKPLGIFMECIEKGIKLPPKGCQEMQKLAETVNKSKLKE